MHDKDILFTPAPKLQNVPTINDAGFDVLNLSTVERKIILATWRMNKTVPQIAKMTGIRVNSLPYMLKRLEQRHLMKKQPPTGALLATWRSDVPKAVRTLQPLAGRLFL
jgi:hypothetical protein